MGDFVRMSVSPNGNFLALFSDEGMLSVVSTNFQDNLANFKTNSESPPVAMCWYHDPKIGAEMMLSSCIGKIWSC